MGEMNLGGLEFKAEDFQQYFGNAVDPTICMAAALRANRLLRERLEKAESAFTGDGTDMWAIWKTGPLAENIAKRGGCRRARLVCIEEVK